MTPEEWLEKKRQEELEEQKQIDSVAVMSYKKCQGLISNAKSFPLKLNPVPAKRLNLSRDIINAGVKKAIAMVKLDGWMVDEEYEPIGRGPNPEVRLLLMINLPDISLEEEE